MYGSGQMHVSPYGWSTGATNVPAPIVNFHIYHSTDYISTNGFVDVWREAHPVPYARCRRERRAMEALGRDAMLQRAVKIWGEVPWHGNPQALNRWHERFWAMFLYEVPGCARGRPWELPRPGFQPAGRRQRIRACGPRWTPIRS